MRRVCKHNLQFLQLKRSTNTQSTPSAGVQASAVIRCISADFHQQATHSSGAVRVCEHLTPAADGRQLLAPTLHHSRKAVPFLSQQAGFGHLRKLFATKSQADAITDDKTKIWDESQHQIKASSLPAYAWPLLVDLRIAGHDVFVVGGTVRDLLINKVPKDVDLVTSASLYQVRKLTRRCQIVGRRHPIALVRAAHGNIIEVSTFDTSSETPYDAAALAKQVFKDKFQPEELGKSWSAVWQQDMQRRDFTVNALMFDPFSRLLFDYVGGLLDCQRRRLHPCGHPLTTMAEDPPRILRGIRLSARTGLQISTATGVAMRKLAPELAHVNESRLNGEATSMLCYGASLTSMQLLWKHQLLDVLMPPHASYLRLYQTSRNAIFLQDSMTSAPLLMRLLHCLDEQASVGEPVSMDIAFAVLTAPILVEAITSRRAELKALIHGASTHAKMEHAPLKASVRSATTVQAKATSETIVDAALQQWHDNMASRTNTSVNVRRREMIHCLTAAAVRTLRSKMLAGMAPKANTVAAQQMLLSFWHVALRESKEGVASHNEDVEPLDSMHIPRNRHAERRQATLNTIFLKADSSWHELLLRSSS